MLCSILNAEEKTAKGKWVDCAREWEREFFESLSASKIVNIYCNVENGMHEAQGPGLNNK